VLYADGSTGHELVGASSFPRHWIYDADGKLAGKSALIDFKTWWRTAAAAGSPWHGQERTVLAAEAETSLERRLSQIIMRGGGAKPRAAKVKAGTTIIAEGEAADDIVLLLDGLVQVEANGTELARLGPGSILGERASVEQGRRTATVRAVTDCRVVSYLAADLLGQDLRELATGTTGKAGEERSGPGPQRGRVFAAHLVRGRVPPVVREKKSNEAERAVVSRSGQRPAPAPLADELHDLRWCPGG
jgi:hypothetical protein